MISPHVYKMLKIPREYQKIVLHLSYSRQIGQSEKKVEEDNHLEMSVSEKRGSHLLIKHQLS